MSEADERAIGVEDDDLEQEVHPSEPEGEVKEDSNQEE